jgi:methylated-DNA-[protein]-cysteine S-methyltransferase
MQWTFLDSPIGRLTLVSDGAALTALHLPAHGETPPGKATPHDPVLTAACAQLAEYFAGQRRDFDLPLAPAGTAFQRAVWSALVGIPFGATASYGEVAARVGRPRAVRAVGAANGRNPIALIVPCHRVIGSDGTLTGYGGGLPTKRWLLAHEARQLSLRGVRQRGGSDLLKAKDLPAV